MQENDGDKFEFDHSFENQLHFTKILLFFFFFLKIPKWYNLHIEQIKCQYIGNLSQGIQAFLVPF